MLRKFATSLPGLILVVVPVGGSAQSGGDAYRGAEVLQKQNCLRCHSVRGSGGKVGPDLGVRRAHQYTPAVMASVMWNHAPAMWSAMTEKGVGRPELTDAQAEDLFAYFYSVRYFDKPGEAERGKRVFEAKHCAGCHGLGTDSAGPGKPLREWTAMTDPILLVQQMWNHSSLMKHALASKNLPWVSLTSQDLIDLTVFVSNLPEMRDKPAQFWLAETKGGEALFKGRGCAGCHTGKLSLETRLHDQTLTDVAAAMWNHAPRMDNAPLVTEDEMRQIVSYVWEKQYLGAPGRPDRGQQVFESKHCATCHESGGAPRLGNKNYSPVEMVAVLWKHGPEMLARMQQQNISWPRFKPDEMSDLVAYLNTKKM